MTTRSKLKSNYLAFVDSNDIEYIVHDFERQGLVSRTKDQFKNALSKLGSSDGTIVIVDDITIDEDVIIPENICLKFFKGGKLTILTKDPIVGENVGTGDGSTTTFILSDSPVLDNSEKIYVNGAEQTKGTDYTIDYLTGTITFTNPPADGDTITVDYTPQYKLTINGHIDAGLFHIFDGNGRVTGNPKIEAVYPEWFGAKGDGEIDDYSAITRALGFCLSSRTGKFVVSKLYAISQTIDLNTDSLYGIGQTTSDEEVPVLYMEGLYPPLAERIGHNNSHLTCGFKWIGMSSDDIIRIDGGSGQYSNQWRGKIHIRNIYLDGNNFSANNGLYIKRRVNRNCTFENITVKYCNNYGIKVGYDDDFHESIFSLTFCNCVVSWNGRGVLLNGNDLTLDECRIEYSKESGLYLLYAINSVRIRGGFMQYNKSPQVVIDGVGGFILLDSVYFEGQYESGPGNLESGGEFIRFPGSIRSELTGVIIRGCRFLVASENYPEDYVVNNFADLWGFRFEENFVAGDNLTIINNNGTINVSSIYLSNYYSAGQGIKEFDSDETLFSFGFVGTRSDLYVSRGLSMQNITALQASASDIPDNTDNVRLNFGQPYTTKLLFPLTFDIIAVSVRLSGNSNIGTIILHEEATGLQETIDLTQDSYSWIFTYEPGQYRISAGELLSPVIDTNGLGTTNEDITVVFWLSLAQKI